MTGRDGAGGSPWRATIAGLCATLVGIGLARFAYTPLIPAVVAAGWFTPSQAAYLGAANLAGYLAGALSARPLAARASAPTLLRTMMLVATAAFFACAVPLSFPWFFAWRFAAGMAGGVLMVLAAPTVLPHVPAGRRGLAGGAIFTGVGLGIAASGTLVPLLLRWGLFETWCSLGAVGLVLTAAAWGGWPAARSGGPETRKPPSAEPRPRAGPALKALYAEYALAAVGLVPHMVFLVDFVARGLGRGIDAGSGYWVLFGLGAMAGAVITGSAADRIGFRRALRLGFAIQAAAVGWLAVSGGAFALAVSSIVIGAFVPGIVTLVLGRVLELAPGDPKAWGLTTVAFALGQAVAAYGYSFLFDRAGSFELLFALGAGAMVLALVIDLGAGAAAATGGDRRQAGDKSA